MLRKIKPGLVSVARAEIKRLEEIATQLLHHNEELREEIRQMQAAMALWAKAAAGTCRRCTFRSIAGRSTYYTKKDCLSDLVQLGETLQNLSLPSEGILSSKNPSL